jgi:hypothetical protein
MREVPEFHGESQRLKSPVHASGPHITGDGMGGLKDYFGLVWANGEYERSRVIRCTAPHDQCPAISRWGTSFGPAKREDSSAPHVHGPAVLGYGARSPLSLRSRCNLAEAQRIRWTSKADCSSRMDDLDCRGSKWLTFPLLKEGMAERD